MSGWSNEFRRRFSSTSARPRGAGAIPDIADIRRRYAEFTARFGAAPEGFTFEQGALGPVKGEWVRAEVGRDRLQDRIILYFHGGGYVSGSPKDYRPLAARLAKTSEAQVFSLAYRLAPEHAFPAGVRDGIDAYRRLLTNGIPAESIVLAGDEAGGGLAFSVMVAIRNASLPMPAACVAMSPWADLSLSGWSVMQNAETDGILSWDLLFVAARHYLKKTNPSDLYASPAFANFKEFPPIMVHAGSAEILRDDASRLGDRAGEAGTPVSIEIYDGMQHLFQAFQDTREASVSLGRIGQFIRARMS